MKKPTMILLNAILLIIIFQSCSDNSNEIPVIEEPKETTKVEQLSEGNQFLAGIY
ncbi:MAG: hypothetical protein IPL08_05160 [Saprospiraceae bacterium]|nr:hypothetical protein [Saprospiraceae bacterium]